MASRISQMRNGMQPYPRTPQAQQQQQLNKGIEETRALMAQLKNAPDPQALLAQVLQQNPNSALIANLLRGNGSLEQIAKQMARVNNIDLPTLINQLQQNF